MTIARHHLTQSGSNSFGKEKVGPGNNLPEIWLVCEMKIGWKLNKNVLIDVHLSSENYIFSTSMYETGCPLINICINISNTVRSEHFVIANPFFSFDRFPFNEN